MKLFVDNIWIPVFTGMTKKLLRLNCHSRAGGNPDVVFAPTFVGMTKILKKQKNKGFTLIEIIILIVMAGILLPVIIIPFATGVKGSQKPEMATTAIYLAHQKMEEFMKYRYLNPALDTIGLTPYADISGFSGYQWRWQIFYVDSNFNVVGDGIQATNHRGYKRIWVQVKDPQGDSYDIYSVVAFSP